MNNMMLGIVICAAVVILFFIAVGIWAIASYLRDMGLNLPIRKGRR